MSWNVGTDIGGTFTDIVAIDTRNGDTRTAKVPSRPDAPVDAMLAAMAAIGLKPSEVHRFVHGTTRITNAIVQERLPPIALIATAGFEDVLEIGRYRRRDLYNLDIPPKAPPLVPHTRCFGLRERILHDGTVHLPLDDAELDRMAAWLATTGVTSVAVCLLHAYANPAHEIRVADRLRALLPHISLSHEVNPEAREYERASSTAYNAAAMPIAADYLSELEHRLPLGPHGDTSGLLVFHSAGGMAPIAAARARPILMAMSGPAAGVAASVQIARDLALPRVLTFDMGGTTTDVCLVVDGAAEMTDTRMTGDRPLRQPMLAVQSIGAGGGSIVTLGPGGLSVGPQSAGVDPGPACYSLGGTRPTITDANAVLGYLDPEATLGGAIRIDVARAHAAIAPIATQLGVTVIEAALGIIDVANATMARALRRVTVERGIDGRDCTLLAFGGGGPMHAAALADLYGLKDIVIPAASSAFSALGCLVADLSFTQQQTIRMPLDGLDLPTFHAALDTLRTRTTTTLPVPNPTITYTALMRYAAQSDTTPVPFTLPFDPVTLHQAFQHRHRTTYGYATEEPCIIETLRIQATKPSPSLGQGGARGGSDHPPELPTSHNPRTRLCHFRHAQNVETPIHPRATLSSPIQGPAIIADTWSTILVPPGWSARPDPHGRLHLSRSNLPLPLGEGRGEGVSTHSQRQAGSSPAHCRPKHPAHDDGSPSTPGLSSPPTPPAPQHSPPDPFTVEVIRHGLSAAAEEMSLLLMRSARSPLLREAGDLSSTITDAQGGLVAQGRDIPVHLGAMAFTIRELLKVHPLERFNEGDALIYNLGALGGNHLNDVKIVRPIFVENRIIAFALSLAHWPDIGGTWPGSYWAQAEDTFQEAIRIPPVNIVTSAGLDTSVIAMIKANVRDPVSAEGDLLGQIAATAAAERRIHDLCRTHGTETFRAAIARLHDLSEAEMRDAIRTIPNGTYEGEDHLDDGGPGNTPARIHVRITIADDEATFDLSGCCDRVPNFCNTTPFIAASAIIYAARLLSGRDLNQNAGALRPLHIITRPGSICEPGFDAPVAAGNHETSARIVDAVIRAMEHVLPERLVAGGPTTAGLLAFAEKRPDGTWRLLYEVHGGGEGARHDRDGSPATRVHMTNTSNTPAEMLEATYALRIEQQSIRRNSGGQGTHKGGDGIIRSYRVLAPRLLLTTCVERTTIPPYSLQGGAPGAPYRIILERDGSTRELPGKANLELFAGDLVSLESCGGGGFGAGR